MNPIMKVKPGVNLAGIRAEIVRAESIVSTVFGRHGYDCWLTSAIRSGEYSFHGKGLAEDFDSSTNVPHDTGKEIERSVKAHLGDSYDVLWHGPYWHLHVEFDPE